MSKKNKLIGNVFGRLTVIKEDTHRTKSGGLKWECVCICGKHIITSGADLISGHTKSCGCIIAEGNNLKHGQNKTTKVSPEYKAWSQAIQRCYNPKIRNYEDYGGRGVVVCERWLNSFENFFEDMGERPSPNHSLDRFPNNNGNYEPSNCRWATLIQQSRNKRNNVLIEFRGKMKILGDWLLELNIPSWAFYRDKKRNIPIDIIFMKRGKLQNNIL